MKRLCPTIQELLAFDAVARYESMTTAANILCISVSGISKQIAGLEDYIGRSLLQKNGRGIRLTPAGHEYWKKISPCLRGVELATSDIRDQATNSGPLVLPCAPTFLTKWLIPRLAAFKDRHPGTSFAFRQHVELYGAFPSGIDAAICHGVGRWPGVKCDYIVGREFVCIYAPSLRIKTRFDQTPDDLIRNNILLHLEDAPVAWDTWAKQHGINEIKAWPGPRFVQYSAVIQAVLSGFGVGLVPRFLVEKQLREGRIHALCSFIDRDQGHFLCYRESALEQTAFSSFRDWLLENGASEPMAPIVPPDRLS